MLILLFSNLVYCEKDEVKRFREYLKLNTAQPTPDYDSAVGFISSEAKDIGLNVQVLELVKAKPLVLLTWSGSNPSLPSVQLNSHMDVVPVESQKWKYQPFQAHKDENGNIFARGSQDMKCVGSQVKHLIHTIRRPCSLFFPTRMN